MPNSHHLTNRNGVFYYRRRVPLTLVSIFGKTTIQVSLDTTDPKEAKKLRLVHDVRWNAEFEAAQEKLLPKGPASDGPAAKAFVPLSEGEVVRLVAAYVERLGDRNRRRLTADPPSSELERLEIKTDAETGVDILKSRDDVRADEQIYKASKEILAPVGLSPDCVPYAAFAEWVRRGLLELSARHVSQIDGDFSRPFFDPAFNSAKSSDVNFGVLSAQYLQNVVDEAAANGTSQKWVEKQRANIALLGEIIGQDMQARDVDYDVCQNARKILARVPLHRSKHYGDISLPEAVQRAQAAGRPVLSPTTQDQYLATLRGILSLAAKKRLIGVNPAEGLAPLKKETLSASDKRLSLTPDQLKGFFEGKYYRQCAAKHAPAYEADKSGWRFWLPLLTLFMGTRPNEICQMNSADVQRTPNGIWYLDIVSDGDDDEAAPGGKTLKTATSRRRVPIHPELIVIGFIKFAQQRQKAEPKGKLFVGLKPDEYGNWAKYPLKRFRETFMPAEIELGERQSYYSLRHCFRDALRLSGAPPDALQALGGWSQGKLVSDDYGDKSNPDYQAQFIAKVEYTCLDLAFLRSETA